MKRSFTLLALVAALLAADAVALADIAPYGGGGNRPRPLPPVSEPAPQADAAVPLTVRDDANASTSRLIIPRRYLEQAGWRKNAGELTGADHIVQSGSHTRTIVAGVALSLAVASIVLLRNRSRAVKITALVAAVGIGTLVATQWMTAAEPQDKVDPQAGGGTRVVIQIVEAGDGVQFVRGTR